MFMKFPGLPSLFNFWGNAAQVVSANAPTRDTTLEQLLHVPPTQRKRSPMPDKTGKGTSTATSILHSSSRVIKNSNERFARVQKDTPDEIEVSAIGRLFQAKTHANILNVSGGEVPC